MMLGRKNNGNRFLPFLIALFFSFLVSGCGRASDTSGLAGEWVLDAVNSGGISLPDLLVSNNRLALRLDADGIGQIAGENSEGRVKWSYDEGTLFLQTGSLFLTGTVENGTIILRTVDGETELWTQAAMHFSANGTAGGRSKTLPETCRSAGMTAAPLLPGRRTEISVCLYGMKTAVGHNPCLKSS